MFYEQCVYGISGVINTPFVAYLLHYIVNNKTQFEIVRYLIMEKSYVKVKILNI